MASAYFGVGAVQGLQRGLEDNRQKKIQDDELAERRLDRAEARQDRQLGRQRAATQDSRATEQYNQEQSERPLRLRSLEASVTGQETNAKLGKVNLETAETNQANAKEDRPRQLARQQVADDTAKFRLQSDKSEEKRRQTTFERTEKEAVKQAQEEGFVEFLDSLEAGADPNYALSRYNSQGKFGIRPGTLKYDKATGALSFVHSDGKKVENFDGTINQLRSIPGLARKPAQVTKIGEGDRLIRTDRVTGATTDVTPKPAAGGAGAGGKFNRQTFIKQAEDRVGEILGGKFDEGTQSFRYDELTRDRGNVGTAFVGRIARTLEEAGVQAEPGEVASMAATATRKIIGATDAKKAVLEDPKFKGAKPTEINAEIDRRVQESKAAAAVQLRADVENFVRTRAVIQEQQRVGADARAGDLPDAKPSAEIGDPSIQAGAPSVDAFKGLPPGKGIKRRDGSIWALGKDGKPKRMN